MLGIIHLVSLFLVSFILEYFFAKLSRIKITKHEFQQILQTKAIFLNSEFFHVKAVKIRKLRKKQIRGEIICEEGFNIKFFSSIGKQNFFLKNDHVKTISAKEEVKNRLLNSFLISLLILFIVIIFFSLFF